MTDESQKMRKIVKQGYDSGDYAGYFRTNNEPNEMELKFLQKLFDMLPKGAEVLDLGCGIGVPFDRWLAKKGCGVTGVDFCRKHIKLAKKNVPNATFIEGDFSKITIGAKKFDAIISFYAIFHIPKEEHETLFLLMSKFLNKNGLLLVTTGAEKDDGEAAESWCGGSKMVWSSHDPAKYKKILKKTGFTILEAAFEGNPGDREYHFWILARKQIGFRKKRYRTRVL